MMKRTEQEKAELEKEILCRQCLTSPIPEIFKNAKSPIPNKRKDRKGYFKAVKEFRKIHNHSIAYVRTIKPEFTDRDLERYEELVEAIGESE